MDNLTAKLYQSSKTILTTKDLALVWAESDQTRLKSKIAYYVKKGTLIRLTRGIFAKDKSFDTKELATSLYAPSYVSFETVLREAGIIFQHYDTIFATGKWSRIVNIDKYTFTFRKLKDEVLFNPNGVIIKGNYSIATPERAFLDMIYLFPNYHFDNLEPINWDQCADIIKVYDNKEMTKRLNKYRKSYA